MIFYTNGLLSKWGFGDGDMLGEFLDEHDLELSFEKEHDALRRIIQEYVAPKIEQTLELVNIYGIHNPIRADTVEGSKVDWFGKNSFSLTPATVEVPDEIVLQICRECRNSEVSLKKKLVDEAWELWGKLDEMYGSTDPKVLKRLYDIRLKVKRRCERRILAYRGLPKKKPT